MCRSSPRIRWWRSRVFPRPRSCRTAWPTPRTAATRSSARRASGWTRGRWTHTTTVSLLPADVLARAKAYFSERLPNQAAFVEKEGPQFVVLRGQGGEEVAFHAAPGDGGVTRVRASTLFFDQAIDRFFASLPLAGAVEVA